MRIAICDKDGEFSKSLKKKLYSYSNANRYEFVVETFKSGEELLKSKNKYILVFIEYKLSGMNGLETAKELRRRGNSCKIIFLTSCTHIVFDAFEVDAYRFLTKPLSEKFLLSTLNDIFTNNISGYPLFINTNSDTFCINTKEIFYLEANNKYCDIHLYDHTVHYKKTMARVYEVLPKPHFQKINRAFVVNLNQIDKYNYNTVFLKNGKELRITRTYYKKFKENYIDFSSPIIL